MEDKVANIDQDPEKAGISHSTSHPDALYLTFIDALRFILAWGVITFLWVMTYKCPDCGLRHAIAHGNFTPLIIGFTGAMIFHIYRLRARNRAKKSKA